MPVRSMTEKKPMNEDTRERWLAKLAKLKIDLKGNPAPHKPLLLLVVIELAEQGLLPRGTFTLTPEIAFAHIGASWRTVALKSPTHDILSITCRVVVFGKPSVKTRTRPRTDD